MKAIESVNEKDAAAQVGDATHRSPGSKDPHHTPEHELVRRKLKSILFTKQQRCREMCITTIYQSDLLKKEIARTWTHQISLYYSSAKWS